MRKFKKVAALGLAVSMILGMLTINASAAEAGTYSDVAENSWFVDAVAYVSEKGLMKGIGEGLFDPDGTTTRGMVVTVLHRLEGTPEAETAASFSDVLNGAWYADAVAWAAEEGIALGHEDGTFLPEENVTREELVTFFYRWAQYKGYRTSLEADLSTYADNAEVQEYAKAPMAWAVAAGMIKGVTLSTLCPLNTATRAEVAEILYRLADGGKVLAAITIDEDLGEDDTPLAETPDLPTPPAPHVHSYTWDVTSEPTCTEAGVETGTCAADGATQTRAIAALGHNAEGIVEHKDATCTEAGVVGGTYCTRCEDGKAAAEATIAKLEHTWVNGECAECGEKKPAKIETESAKEALEGVLAGIKGNDNAQLVTIGGAGDAYTITLNADAIKGSGQSFGDNLLNGLVTNLKNALDSYFDKYTLSVNEKNVYADGKFNNSQLKAAIYDVAGGFFYTLAKMEPVEIEGTKIYTYKTVDGVVTDGAADTYSFSVAIQLSGNDVEKVQKMASILEKHLSMTTMSKEEAAKYGITGENDFILVKMEMPDAIMKTLQTKLGDNVTADQVANYTSIFNGMPVKTIISTMAGMDINVNQLVGSGAEELQTLVSMVNGNANLVNKVLSKLTITVKNQNLENEALISGKFAPAENSLKGLMGAINNLVPGTLTVTPGQFQIEGKPDYYLVPITVDINLGETFKGTETVLFELHIPLSKLAKPEPTEPTAEEVTKAAAAKVAKELEGYKGHGKQLVTLTEVAGGYDLTLNADAIDAAAEILSGNGLATAIGTAMQETFKGFTLSVAGNTVYSAEGKFNNTELKKALFSVADGFFYTLSNMKANDDDTYTYKTVKAAVGNYEFNVSVKLSGNDVDKVQSLAGKLAKYLSMNTKSATEVANWYVGSEETYIVVEVTMPKAVQDFLAENKNLTAETFDNIPVMTAISGLANNDVPGMLGDNAANINSVISLVNSNTGLINTVLRHATITVAGQTMGSTFTPGNEGSEWEKFMSGVLGMVGNAEFGQIKDYAKGSGTYVIPVTVAIDLEAAMGFTANETVLVVLHIPFGE